MTTYSNTHGSRFSKTLARLGTAALLLLLGNGCTSSAPHASATALAGKSSALDDYAGRCDAGQFDACSNAARVLVNPASKVHDDALAAQYRTRACNGNAYFCGDLGEMYVAGKGVEKDEARGLSYLDRGCAAKNTAACAAASHERQAQVVAQAPRIAAPPAQTQTPDSPAQAKGAPSSAKQAPAKKHAKKSKRAAK